jgi:hypothetical protein
MIANQIGCKVDDICDFELQACDTQPSVIAGAAKEFIFSGRLDNLCSSFCSLKVLLVTWAVVRLQIMLVCMISGPVRQSHHYCIASLFSDYKICCCSIEQRMPPHVRSKLSCQFRWYYIPLPLAFYLSTTSLSDAFCSTKRRTYSVLSCVVNTESNSKFLCLCWALGIGLYSFLAKVIVWISFSTWSLNFRFVLFEFQLLLYFGS